MLLLYFFYQNKQGCDYFAINKQRSAEARGQNSRLAPGPATLSRGGGGAVHAPHHPTAVGVLSGRSPAASRLGKRPPPPPHSGYPRGDTLRGTLVGSLENSPPGPRSRPPQRGTLRGGRSPLDGSRKTQGARGGVFLRQRGPRIPHSTQSK